MSMFCFETRIVQRLSRSYSLVLCLTHADSDSGLLSRRTQVPTRMWVQDTTMQVPFDAGE